MAQCVAELLMGLILCSCKDNLMHLGNKILTKKRTRRVLKSLKYLLMSNMGKNKRILPFHCLKAQLILTNVKQKDEP